MVDDGIGIASENLNSIFDRFGRRKESSGGKKDAGIGFGLMIVKKIIRKNGGKIKVHSDGIGKGTCIMFSMKMHPNNNEE